MKLKWCSFEQFLLLSVIVHIAGFAVWWRDEPDQTVVAKKVDTLNISVGLQAALAGAQTATPTMIAQPELEPVEQEVELVPEPLEQIEPESVVEVEEAIPVDAPKPIEPPKSKPTPKENKAEKKPPQPSPKKVVKPEPKVKPKPKAKPEPQQVKPQQATPNIQAQKIGAQGENGAKVNEVKVAETGVGKVSGGINSEEQFDYLIHQHLLKHKTAPKMLQTKRKRGVVKVEFTIDREGQVLSYKLAKPSRIRDFDRAAMKLGRAAVPFPKAPESVTWQQRTFTLDVIYEIK